MIPKPAYYLANDIEGRLVFTVNSCADQTQTVYLCLNGKTIGGTNDNEAISFRGNNSGKSNRVL